MMDEQITRIETNLRFVWSEYLRWYTFLSTLNLIGLGFFLGPGKDTGAAVPAAFLMFNVLGLITSMLVFPYTRNTLMAIAKLDEAILSERPEQRLRGSQNGIPRGIAYWALFANAVSFVLFVGLWAYQLKKHL